MKHVYVAGRDPARAKRMMERLESAGYKVSFDWTTDLEAEQAGKAACELAAIRSSDAFVLLREAGQESALYEAGMAMGLGLPVIVVGDRDEWFFSLPFVHRTNRDGLVVPLLWRVVPSWGGAA